MNEIVKPSQVSIALASHPGSVLVPSGGGEYASGLEPHPLHNFFETVKRHPWLIAGITLAVLAIGGQRLLSAPPEYQATATVRIANLRRALTGSLGATGTDQQMMGRYADPLLSEVQVLTSRSLARDVVARAGLRLWPVTPEVTPRLLQNVKVSGAKIGDTVTVRLGPQQVVAASGGVTVEGPYGQTIDLGGVSFSVPLPPVKPASGKLVVLDEQDAMDVVIGGVHPLPRELTDVVDIQYTGGNPELAQYVANALAVSFQEHSATRAQEESRRRRSFLQHQLASTDSVLRGAQAALSDFRSRKQTYSSSQRFAAQETKLATIEARQEQLVADRKLYEAVLSRLQDDANTNALAGVLSTPELAGNVVIAGMFQQLMSYELKRDSVMGGMWGSTARDPDVQRLDALIRNARAQLLSTVREQLTILDARIAALGQVRSSNTTELVALPANEAEEVGLLEQVEAARSLATQLREEFQKAGLSEAVEMGNVEIIDLAERPGVPVSRGIMPKMLMLLMLGLLAGTGAANLIERVNTTIRKRDEVEPLVHAPVLSVVPPLVTTDRVERAGALARALRRGSLVPQRNGRPTVLTELNNAAGEAFRMLRTGLLFSRSDSLIRSVLVTSASPSEGKSTASAHLALSYAESGAKTLLVDCDLRRPAQHRMFGITRGPGLSELVLGMADVKDAIRPGPIANLSILPCGRATPNPAEFATGSHVRSVLKDLFQQYEFVVLDAPPTLLASEAAILATMCDGVVLVVRAGHTERATAQQAARQLASVGARIVGVVLNDPESKATHQRYAYYPDEAGHSAART